MTVDAVAWLIYGCARHGREGEVELWDCQHFGGFKPFQAPSSQDTVDPRKTLIVRCGPLVAARDRRLANGQYGGRVSRRLYWTESHKISSQQVQQTPDRFGSSEAQCRSRPPRRRPQSHEGPKIEAKRGTAKRQARPARGPSPTSLTLDPTNPTNDDAAPSSNLQRLPAGVDRDLLLVAGRCSGSTTTLHRTTSQAKSASSTTTHHPAQRIPSRRGGISLPIGLNTMHSTYCVQKR
ncbi:hypothetical protein NA56DRAFT_704792 [Hyaloscypha hepaticicola]|uniref:Uncharacterized protein n=1 Tax=Hyaloscypha hepaticicola TaxID=2082293 RepID=A0A2J6Q2E4_9HELO|nr:hypothetical protein NA56DRAFT_704792 [Hyaloscypha hepaticicola]